MVYDIKGYKIDINDEFLKQFQTEMHNISQDMIETCAKIALLD